jgi:hypothetical protein
MKKATSIITALSMAVVLSGASGTPLPEVVAAHIADMDKSCKEDGGTPAPSMAFEGGQSPVRPAELVEHGVLVGGLTEFWAFDEGRYRCDGAASIFSGSGGAQVYVFVRLNDGRVKQVFMHGADGMSLKRVGSSSELLLRVGGGLCRQAGNLTHAYTIGCERPLIWDKTAQKMDFAPLREPRPF